jgi:hypothetical protein
MSTVIKLVPMELDTTIRGVSAEDRQTVLEILADLTNVAERIKRASVKWIALPDRTRARVLEAVSPTAKTFLDRLTKVGEGTLHPMLYNSVGKASHYLGKLPLPEQDLYLRERIPVAVLNGGKADMLNVDIEDMTPNQRKQVFKVHGDVVTVRSIAEQRAWLADQEQRRQRIEDEELNALTVINRPGRWKIEKGKVWLDTDKLETGLTKRDIAQMLRDLNA